MCRYNSERVQLGNKASGPSGHSIEILNQNEKVPRFGMSLEWEAYDSVFVPSHKPTSVAESIM